MSDRRPLLNESGGNVEQGFQPITETYAHGDSPLAMVEHSDEEELRNLLMGHRVDKVTDDHLVLDDGTVLRIVPNEGGCSCRAGDYELASLNRVDNIITKVEFDYQPTGDYSDYSEDEKAGFYRIFVLAGDERINLLSVEGDDGNGYYGTGFHLMVRRPKEVADG